MMVRPAKTFTFRVLPAPLVRVDLLERLVSLDQQDRLDLQVRPVPQDQPGRPALSPLKY